VVYTSWGGVCKLNGEFEKKKKTTKVIKKRENQETKKCKKKKKREKKKKKKKKKKIRKEVKMGVLRRTESGSEISGSRRGRSEEEWRIEERRLEYTIGVIGGGKDARDWHKVIISRMCNSHLMLGLEIYLIDLEEDRVRLKFHWTKGVVEG